MKLSEFELDVMQIFWEEGVSSAPEVFKLISGDRKVTYSTVKTIIDRLEEKGAIARERTEGRSIFYAPIVEKLAISQKLLPSFLKRFFNGRSSDLVAHLIREDKLTKDDIEFLEHFISEKKQDKE